MIYSYDKENYEKVKEKIQRFFYAEDRNIKMLTQVFSYKPGHFIFCIVNNIYPVLTRSKIVNIDLFSCKKFLQQIDNKLINKEEFVVVMQWGLSGKKIKQLLEDYTFIRLLNNIELHLFIDKKDIDKIGGLKYKFNALKEEINVV